MVIVLRCLVKALSPGPWVQSGNSVDESVNSLNAVKIHQTIKNNVQSLKRDKRLVEHFAIEAAGGLGIESGNASGEGSLKGHCLEVLCGLPLDQ